MKSVRMVTQGESMAISESLEHILKTADILSANPMTKKNLCRSGCCPVILMRIWQKHHSK